MIADARVGLARIARPKALEQTSATNCGGPSLLASPSPRGIDRRVDHGEGGHATDSA